VNLWSCFEALSGLSAVPAVWRARLGADFAPFRNTFLEARPRTVLSFPCPRHCGCAHRVVTHTDGTIVGVCQCKPRTCDNLELTIPDITPLELNWPKFARAIAKAFGLAVRFEPFSGRYTAQIGSWSADPVPVILTIQCDQNEFRHVVASLVARLHCRFILLAPTCSYMDAASLGYLANIDAEFFPLESHLILTEHGTFQPKKPPGEIFACFMPAVSDDDEMLRNTMALVKEVDAGQGARKVSLYTVMRLYCVDCLTAAQIARKCGCARSLIYSRISELRERLKRDPAELRPHCAQFDNIDASLSDPRAKRVFRKGAVYGDDYS